MECVVPFHAKNGYANAWPCCVIRVWLSSLYFVFIERNIKRFLSLFTTVLASLSFHHLNGGLGESIVIILLLLLLLLLLLFSLELVKSVTFFLVKNFTC